MDRARWIGWILSVVVHAAFLFRTGRLVTQKVEYGVAPGRSSVAVELVEGAAPAAETKIESPSPEAFPRSHPDEMAPAIVRKPELPPAPAARPAPKRPPRLRPAAATSRGLRGAGPDTATFQRTAGSSSARPDYLRNPPPAYPEESRRRREEGTVLVKVFVSPLGTPQAVSLYRSSGFPALDQAALEAVRRWRFRPATAGGAPVASYAVVPISFHLTDR